MVNAKIRLIIFFAAKYGEDIYEIRQWPLGDPDVYDMDIFLIFLISLILHWNI